MRPRLEAHLIPAGTDTWATEIDRLRKGLGAPHNPSLFPPHFLKATFPTLGGQILVFEEDRQTIGVGFLFPRACQAGIWEYTLRFHRTDPCIEIDREELAHTGEKLLGTGKVVFYDPQAEQIYAKTARRIDGVEIGRPDAEEAVAVRRLQQTIWQSEPDFLYPSDIHSLGFRAGTSLVARVHGQPAGFLFGFYKFRGRQLPDLWQQQYQGEFRLESQLLGVLLTHRGRDIGFYLKAMQAENARCEGIDIVNWTVDPLQYGNAVLNFGKLKAIAYAFYPNYYDFRNILNQTATSRLAITWLVNSKLVKQALPRAPHGTSINLRNHTTIRRVNRGWETLTLNETAKAIAIEVPARWTALQRDDPVLAWRWRTTTDTLFQHYLGPEEEQYMITNVGEDGARKYLIAERVGPALLARYAK